MAFEPIQIKQMFVESMYILLMYSEICFPAAFLKKYYLSTILNWRTKIYFALFL